MSGERTRSRAGQVSGKMSCLLDTNILSDLIKNPDGVIMQRIAEIGEDNMTTNVIVAAELRFGAEKRV